MGLPVTGLVGIPGGPYASATQPSPTLGRFGQALTEGTFGKYYEAVKKGWGFCYSDTLAGHALIAAGTANAPLIANFSGSNVDLVILKICFARTAVGTPLEGSIVYLREAAAIGAAVGTGAPIVSGTPVAARNLLGAGQGNASGVSFYPTTVTATSGALTYAMNSGIAQTADNGATTVGGPQNFSLVDHVDGMIVIPPGGAFAIAAAVSVSTTYSTTIFGLEIPRS